MILNETTISSEQYKPIFNSIWLVPHAAHAEIVLGHFESEIAFLQTDIGHNGQLSMIYL